MRGTLLGSVLLVSCLNPMPEELPSHDGAITMDRPVDPNPGEGAPPVPTPTNGLGDPSPVGQDSGGSTGAEGTPPPAATPAPGEERDDGDVPDAGTDAGAASPDDTGSDDTSPGSERPL